MGLSLMVNHPMTGSVMRRTISRYTGMGALVPCADGHVAVITYRLPSDVLARLLDDPRLLDERFATAMGREEHAVEFREIIRQSLSKRGKLELFHGAQELRLQWAMVQSPADGLACQQHAQRKFFQALSLQDGREVPAPVLPFCHGEQERASHGAPEFVDGSTVAWTTSHTPAATAPSRSSGRKALEGLNVLEMTFAWAGPVAGRILCDYGATVVKVESRRYPDTARALPAADFSFGKRWYDRCLAYMVANAGKYHIGLEVDRPEGKEVFLDLARWADVVIENFTPRVMPNLGLGWDVLSRVNPRLVMLSLTGFGQQGPYRNYGAWGWGLEALGGISYDTGYLDDPEPIWFHPTLPDPLSALSGVVAVMSALEERRRTGKGQWIDLSQYEVSSLAGMPQLLEHAATGKLRGRIADRHRWLAPQGVYSCAGSDEWVAIAIASDEQWRRLCELIGRKDLADYPSLQTHPGRWQQQERIDQAVSEWTRGRTKHEAMQALQAAGVPAGAVLNSKEIHDDPHIRSLEYFRAAEARETGLRVYPGPWQHMGSTPGLIQRGVADFGESNMDVLRDILCYSEDQIGRLAAADVLSTEFSAYDQPPNPTIPIETQLELELIREWDSNYHEVVKAVRRDDL
jgi:crotonobetainyl-CoA:carnitine CoA-transferase CaiB-like acyl-CoA transferase